MITRLPRPEVRLAKGIAIRTPFEVFSKSISLSRTRATLGQSVRYQSDVMRSRVLRACVRAHFSM